jgi:hypothetical protein
MHKWHQHLRDTNHEASAAQQALPPHNTVIGGCARKIPTRSAKHCLPVTHEHTAVLEKNT